MAIHAVRARGFHSNDGTKGFQLIVLKAFYSYGLLAAISLAAKRGR